MKKHRFWGVTVLILLALLVVGCQAQSSSGNNKSSGSSSSSRIKITYWHRLTGQWNKAQQQMIDEFNKSQNKYQVVANSMGSYDALQQKIMAAGKSKTLPTISQSPYTNLGDYAKSGLIEPITDLFEGQNALSKEQQADIIPSFLATGKFDGKQYALPFSISTRVLFYNEKILNDNGLSVPKTWADVQAMGPKLREKGLYSMIFDTSYDVELEGMANGAGEKMITNDLKVNINTPKTVSAMNLILSLIKQKYARTALEDKYFSYPFAAGKTAMGIGSSATIPGILSAAPKSLKWNTAQVPEFEGKNTTALAGNDIVLMKGATKQQKAGAMAFMKFLLKKKNVINWAMKSGYQPVTTSGLKSSEYQAYLKKHPQYQAAADAIKNSFASTVFVGYGEYRNSLLTAIDNTVSKKQSAETVLDRLASEANKAIDKNK